jgi:excinuclease ABC subunit C
MDKKHTSISKLPDTPGVYFFIGAQKEILYVGKATSLKSRVRSYFSTQLHKTRSAQIVQMVEHAECVEYTKTDSVLEALILEANLIREFKPVYNTREKDDKSFNYLVITIQEEYPRLLTVRGKDLTRRLGELRLQSKKLKQKRIEPLVYGPFPHAGQFKEALKIVRKIFPYYDTKHLVHTLIEKKDKKMLFNQSINVYPEASVTKTEYRRTIRYIKMFFDGKLKTLLRTLERDMRRFAKAEKFEQAGVLKRQLFALQHINDISLIRREQKNIGDGAYRIEGYDVAHLSGSDTVGVMVVVEHGECIKREYRTFTIKNAARGSDTGALKEMLERRLAHPEWQYPRLVVIDGGRAQINTAKRVFHEAGVEIPIVAVTKNKQHKPSVLQGPINIKNKYAQDILLANNEAHRFALRVHTRKRSKHLHQ